MTHEFATEMLATRREIRATVADSGYSACCRLFEMASDAAATRYSYSPYDIHEHEATDDAIHNRHFIYTSGSEQEEADDHPGMAAISTWDCCRADGMTVREVSVSWRKPGSLAATNFVYLTDQDGHTSYQTRQVGTDGTTRDITQPLHQATTIMRAIRTVDALREEALATAVSRGHAVVSTGSLALQQPRQR